MRQDTLEVGGRGPIASGVLRVESFTEYDSAGRLALVDSRSYDDVDGTNVGQIRDVF